MRCYCDTLPKGEICWKCEDNKITGATPMSDPDNCPFCNTEMRIKSNRDWHRLKGNHAGDCVFEAEEEAMMVSATDANLAWMIAVWNKREGK